MHILDLPENIFRNIFECLEDNVIYFKLKAVCRQFHLYSNNYIRLEGVFLLHHGVISGTVRAYELYEFAVPEQTSSGEIFLEGSVSTWCLRIFTKRQIISSFHCERLSFSRIGHDATKKYYNSIGRECTSTMFGIVSNGILLPESAFSPPQRRSAPC